METNKITTLLEDEAFVRKLAACSSIEDMQAAFHDEGVDMTVEQTEEFVKSLDTAGAEQGEELTEDALENVSGGRLVVTPYGPLVVTARILMLLARYGIPLGKPITFSLWKKLKG